MTHLVIITNQKSQSSLREMEMHTYETIGHQQHYGKTKSSKTESRIDSEAVYEPPSITTQPVTNEYQKPNLQLTSDKHDTVAVGRNPNRNKN